MRHYKLIQLVGMSALAFVLGACIGYIRPLIERCVQEERFMIYHSFSFESSYYKDTSIWVIVNVQDYDMVDMFEEVRDFYNNLNGEPDELEIRLYNSMNDFKDLNCAGRKIYYKKREKNFKNV